MLRIKYLLTACALALSIGAANAAVVEFDVMGTTADGTFSGTIGVDVTDPANLSSDYANIISSDFPAKSFFDIFVDITPIPSPFPSTDIGLEISDGTGGTGDHLSLYIPPSSLTDAGGLIDGGAFDHGALKGPPIGITGGSIAETPLPATLPLFASGLGALGLLGWRRKRKSTAALAA